MIVKRYEMKTTYRGHESWDSLEEDEEGGYVDYEDYVAMEKKLTDMAVQLANADSKCRELAAELSAVDKIHNDAVFITDDHYEQCPPEVQKMIRSLAVLQIPAYDAFLAEVRAQGVEMFAEMYACEAIKDSDVEGWKSKASNAASEYAAQLRQEAAQ